MDDLISRKAALEALGECPENWEDSPEEIEAVNSWLRAAEVINSAPSVSAVPLDKLCEWLADHYGFPCQIINDCSVENGPCGMEGVGQIQSVDCWHYLIRAQLLKEDRK